MGVVRLRGPLKTLADNRGEHTLQGATVGELLHNLEHDHPALSGWILDERGCVRRHINVFVNGERGKEQTEIADGDRIEVVPAITGG